MIRVLICDDHLIVRQGLKQILADAPDIDIAGEAASGALSLGPDWKLRPTRELLEQLEHLLGQGAARLRYAHEGAGHSAVSA